MYILWTEFSPLRHLLLPRPCDPKTLMSTVGASMGQTPSGAMRAIHHFCRWYMITITSLITFRTLLITYHSCDIWSCASQTWFEVPIWPCVPMARCIVRLTANPSCTFWNTNDLIKCHEHKWSVVLSHKYFLSHVYLYVFHRHTYFAISKSDTELFAGRERFNSNYLAQFCDDIMATCRNLWILVRSYHWSMKNSFFLNKNLLDLFFRPVLNWQPGDICVFEAGRKVWCIRWNGRKGRKYQRQ